MPEVLEAEPQAIKRPVPPGLTPFTSQTASEAARRKHQLERERAEAEELARKAALASATQPDAAKAVCEQLQLIQEVITSTRKALNEDMEPHHRAQMVRAYLDALATQRKLLGIHDPGPSKAPAPPKRERESRSVTGPIG